MKIILTNGEVKEGNFYLDQKVMGFVKKPVLKSKETKEKYKLEQVEGALVYSDDGKPDTYKVVWVRKYLDSKKTRRKFGRLIFAGNRINLYEVSEVIYTGSGFGIHVQGEYGQYYAMKASDTIAYNVGYIYGAGQKGIKKRVRSYFKDCPSLVQKVVDKSIPKEETFAIIEYYENNCASSN